MADKELTALRAKKGGSVRSLSSKLATPEPAAAEKKPGGSGKKSVKNLGSIFDQPAEQEPARKPANKTGGKKAAAVTGWTVPTAATQPAIGADVPAMMVDLAKVQRQAAQQSADSVAAATAKREAQAAATAKAVSEARAEKVAGAGPHNMDYPPKRWP